jgi:hypothetical protein
MPSSSPRRHHDFRGRSDSPIKRWTPSVSTFPLILALFGSSLTLRYQDQRRYEVSCKAHSTFSFQRRTSLSSAQADLSSSYLRPWRQDLCFAPLRGRLTPHCRSARPRRPRSSPAPPLLACPRPPLRPRLAPPLPPLLLVLRCCRRPPSPPPLPSQRRSPRPPPPPSSSSPPPLPPRLGPPSPVPPPPTPPPPPRRRRRRSRRRRSKNSFFF